MFGAHKNKRLNQKLERDRDVFQNEVTRFKKEQLERQPSREAFDQEVHQGAEKQKQRDQTARMEGRANADEFLARKYEGLGAQERSAYQETANAQINRQLQEQNRSLVSQQGRRGVRGGAAFNQQRELARVGAEAQQQNQRDLSIMDSNLARARQAQAFNIEQGAIGDSAYRYQMARDDLNAYDDKIYNRNLVDDALNDYRYQMNKKNGNDGVSPAMVQSTVDKAKNKSQNSASSSSVLTANAAGYKPKRIFQRA